MLKAVYKGGSSVILPNPNDTDYFYFYDNEQERNEAFKKNKDRSCDNHYKLLSDNPKVFFGCYAYPRMVLIRGEEIESFKKFSILKHKKEYSKVALNYISFLKNQSKTWYHIVVAYFMFKNGKESLTEEQINIVQKVHDCGIDQELKDKITEEFKLWE